MKALVYLSAIATIFITACSTTRTTTVANDDIYYTPGEQTVIVEEPANTAPSSDLNYRSNDYSRSSENYRDGQGNTYITNNYYDDYDYYYTSRLRRYYRPYVGFNYYSGIYTDYYWYTHNPSYYGVSIYIGSGYPYHRPYHPYHNYYGYNHYNPYFSYNPYAYHHHHLYGGSYWSGYNHGYYNGYYNGLYGNPYNNNYGGYYGGNDYNLGGNTNRYYGPRNTMSTNTGGGNRTSDVSYGKTGGVKGSTPGKNITTDQVESSGSEGRTDKVNKGIQNTGSVSENRTGTNNDGKTNTVVRDRNASNEGRTVVSTERNPAVVKEGRAIIEDKPRTYQSERNNSIYAPERQVNERETTVTNPSDRYIQNNTDRSGYERERYYPSNERNTTPVQTERRNDNSIYQPRINTDTRDNRGYTPSRSSQPSERIYTPRQSESAPVRQQAPQREAAPQPQRRIERRSNPAPKREYTPAPAPSNNSGSQAVPSRSGTSEKSSGGRRGR